MRRGPSVGGGEIATQSSTGSNHSIACSTTAARLQALGAAVVELEQLQEPRHKRKGGGGRGKKRRQLGARLAAEAAAAFAQAVAADGARSSGETVAAIERAVAVAKLVVDGSSSTPLGWYVWAADILKSVLKKSDAAASTIQAGVEAAARQGVLPEALASPAVPQRLAWALRRLRKQGTAGNTAVARLEATLEMAAPGWQRDLRASAAAAKTAAAGSIEDRWRVLDPIDEGKALHRPHSGLVPGAASIPLELEGLAVPAQIRAVASSPSVLIVDG